MLQQGFYFTKNHQTIIGHGLSNPKYITHISEPYPYLYTIPNFLFSK
jgi:hypothetical protein